MIAGRLNRRVALRQYEITQHATSGEPVETCTKELTVYASIRGLTPKERFQGGRVTSADAAIMVCRFADAKEVDTKWRVQDHNGKVWRIAGNPREIGREEGLEIMLEVFQ